MRKNFLLLLYGAVILLISLFIGCSEEDAPLSNPPQIIMNEADAITRISASVSCNVQATADMGVKSFGIAYSTVSSMPNENTTRIELPFTPSQQMYATVLSSLVPDTEYYYYFFAGNGHNEVKGNRLSFRTKSSDVPMLDKVTVGEITETTASLMCRFLDKGGSSIIRYGFAYRKLDADKEVEEPVGNQIGDGENTFSLTLSDLQPGAQYLVRAYAINSMGVGYSEYCEVETEMPDTPRLSLVTATNITESSMEIEARIITSGSSPVSTIGFRYKTLTGSEITIPVSLEELAPDNTFKVVLAGLASQTTYLVRAYAGNDSGTTYSDYAEFVTLMSDTPNIDDNPSPEIKK